MKIYDIDQALTALIDPGTGEVLDFDAFAELQMEREAKVENMALWFKELCATATAIREEEKILAERRKASENKAERLKNYLELILCGNAFETSKCKIAFKASTAVEVSEGFVPEERFLRIKPPELDKKALTDALKSGEIIEGAELVKKNNIQIK